MPAGQHLRGFVGQGMDGQRKTFTPYTASYGPGTFTWTAPLPGFYRFVQWGCGGRASAAHAQTVVHLNTGDRVSLVVAEGVSTDTVVTFPSGRVVTAGSAVLSLGETPGVATGGDLNLNGSVSGTPSGGNGVAGLGDNGGLGGTGNGATSGGGGGAPGYGGFRGGDGGSTAGDQIGRAPGGGSTTPFSAGGVGLVIIARQPNNIV
jgi:hypothetical protein